MFNFKSKTKPKDGTTLRQTDAQATETGLDAPLSPPPPSSSLTMNKDDGLDHNHPGAPAGEIRYAGLPIRTAALVADEFLLFCLQVVPIVILAMSSWIIPEPSMQLIGVLLSIPAVLGAFLVQYWLYTAWFEHSKMSGTPGKFLFGLKVVDTKFKTLSFWQSTKRLLLQFLIVMLLSLPISLAIYLGVIALSHNSDSTRTINTNSAILIAFFMGTCVCLFNKRRQTLFDFVAHRFVIYSEGISQEPTWKQTDGQGRLRKFRERVKECAVISWRELPGNWLKIPVAIYVVCCLAFTMCNLATVTQSIWRIAQIEGVLDKKSDIAILPLPKRLAALHISTATAQADYKTITPLVTSASKIGYDWRKPLIARKLELNPYYDRSQTAMAEYDLKVAKDFRKAEKEYMQLANTAQFVGQSTKADSLAGAAESAMNYDTKRAQYLVQSALAYNPFHVRALTLKLALDEKVGNKAAIKEDTRRIATAVASPYGSLDWLSDIYASNDDTTLNTAKAGCEELLKKDRNCTSAHIILGEYLTIKKKLAEAERHYTIATTIDARDPLPFADRADFYASEKLQFDKAIADINKALAICETEALLKTRAGFYEQAHNLDKAKSDHIRLCQLHPSVENLTEYGQFLYDNGDTAAAREIANRAQAACDYDTSLQPKKDSSVESEYSPVDGAGLLVSLCRLQHHCGDDEGAEKTLQRLLSFAPDDSQRADLLIMLGKADQALAAYSADIDKEIKNERNKSGPVEQARKALAKTFIGVPFASHVFGRPDNQDIPGISKDVAFEIDDNATLARLYCERGDFHFKRGDFNKAISDYDLAASTSENESSNRQDLAYLLANGPKKTIALITKRISEGGYSADDQLYLSELYKRVSEPAKAAACKKKAFAEINGLIKDDPTDANNIWARGQLYMRTGEFQKALSDFSRAIALNKDPDVSYYNDRARCYTALGRFDLAIKDADKAQPNTAVIPKAVGLFGKGSTKEALAGFNTALNNDEFNTNALYGRSRLYQKLGNKKAAESDLALATKYGYFVNPELVRYNYDKF